MAAENCNSQQAFCLSIPSCPSTGLSGGSGLARALQYCLHFKTSLMAQKLKNLPAMQETQV